MALSNYVPRYTVEEHALWEGEWELWSGSPVAMSPSPGMVHQTLVYRLTRALDEGIKREQCSRCRVYFDLDWRISNDTVLRPDVSVICDGPTNLAYLSQTPGLVAEILSDSTRQRDLLYKRDMYEKLGVKFYLIVDPDGELLLNKLSQGRYRSSSEWRLQLEDDCEIDLDLSAIFEDL